MLLIVVVINVNFRKFYVIRTHSVILVEILVSLFWLLGPSGRARGRAQTKIPCLASGATG